MQNIVWVWTDGGDGARVGVVFPMNHLENEKSPYLIQHRGNPVEWWPWGGAAFERAKAEDKPVFLSIGYSTCHWCHVMAHESFENEATARLMNAHFVNIKVDREERPDVDRVYMAFVQAATGSGGWPLSVWLTPEGRPFFGGTYFPPEDRFGRASFSRVLRQIAELWKGERARIETEAGRVMAVLGEAAEVTSGGLDPGWLGEAFRVFQRTFDGEHGGFGGAPKFPRPVVLNFLERCGPEGQRMARETLKAMARGGMYDQIGGGFHRYSVDEYWHVPHFEKMLYDQAQLVTALVEAWQVGGDPFFERVARETITYALRDLRHSDGGFFSAEDADSLIEGGGHAEGAFYVWTEAEIHEVLAGGDAVGFCEYFGVRAGGNAPAGSDPHGELAGKNVLTVRGGTGREPAEWERLRAVLFERRARRPRPHLDDKILTAWNGLMISALALAGRAFGDEDYIAAAERAAEFVSRNLVGPDGGLLRSWRDGPSAVRGFCEDHAFLIRGLLDLYEARFDLRWMRWALELQAAQDALFTDEAGGGYFSSRAGDPLVPLRLKEDYDGAEPSAGAVSAGNLLRLARWTQSKDFEDRARRVLSAHAESMRKAPSAVPQMLVALDLALAPPAQAVVAGTRESAAALLASLGRSFRPHLVTVLLDGPAAREFFSARIPEVAGMVPIEGKAALYLCENFTCQAPVTEL